MPVAWVFGDDVNTDVIIPGRYNITTDEQELARHAFIEVEPAFPARVKPGDVVVGGRNFGCGSSREHAPLALRGNKVAAVVAKSFARIFYRNAINIGLPVLEIPDLEGIETGDEINLNLEEGTLHVNGRTVRPRPLPSFIQAIVDAGGIINYLKIHDLGDAIGTS